MSDGPVIDAYCDESHDHKGPRYMAYGAMIAAASDLPAICDEIKAWRASQNMYREMKWTKIKHQYVQKYLSLVDLFASLSSRDLIHFKAAVFDKQKIDYKKYHDGSWLRGRYVFFYYLLLHKFCVHATSNDHRLRVFFDDTTYEYPLGDFKRILNFGMCKKYNRTGQIIRSVEPVDSKKNDLVQIADVLMGAIAFHYNEAHLASGAHTAKVAVAAHLAKSVKLPTLKASTGPLRKRFEIWPFRLR